jgi:hypothetical protein
MLHGVKEGVQNAVLASVHNIVLFSALLVYLLFVDRHFSIIRSPTSVYFHWPLSFWLFYQNPICIPFLPMRAICPAHIRRDISNYAWRKVQVMKLQIM